MGPRELGARLRSARRRADLTQEELSDAARVTVGDISRWECGRSVPNLFSMMRLALALGVKLDDLAPVDSAAAKPRKRESEGQVTPKDGLTGTHGEVTT